MGIGRMTQSKEVNPFFEKTDFKFDVVGRMAEPKLDLNLPQTSISTLGVPKEPSAIPFLPQAIKETIEAQININPEVRKAYESGDILGAFKAGGESIPDLAKDWAKNVYGSIATIPVVATAVQQHKGIPEEIKIPFTDATAPLINKTYNDARKAGFDPLFATIATMGRVAMDVLILEAVARPTIKAIGKIPVERPSVVSLTRKDIFNISIEKIKAGNPKYDAWAKFSNENKIDIFKIIKEKGKTDIVTGKPKTLADIIVEQYGAARASQAGFAKTPGFKGRMADEIKPEVIKPKEIVHGTSADIVKIKKDGFTFGKNSVFGKAAFFTDSNQNRIAFGDNVIKVNPDDFNLKTITTVEEQNNFIKKQGVNNLSEAIIKEGKFDGFIIPNKDPKVGNTYGIINKTKLDSIIKDTPEPLAKETDMLPKLQTEPSTEQVNKLLKAYDKTTDPLVIENIIEELEMIDPILANKLSAGKLFISPDKIPTNLAVGPKITPKQEQLIQEEAFKDIVPDREFQGELENQYEEFKSLKLRKLDEIEDATQLKKLKPNVNIDNILYSQEKSVDEVFDMFKKRLTTERVEGFKPKGAGVIVRTKEYDAISDKLKSKITSFFRPARKRKSRAFALLDNKDTTVPLFEDMFDNWVKSGTEAIVEPFAGAYTLGTHSLDKAIKSGLKEFNSNIFDKEKYIIIKEIEKGNMVGVEKSITNAVDTFNNAILSSAAGDPLVEGTFREFFQAFPDSYIGSNDWYGWIRKQDIGKRVTVYKDDYEKFRKVFQDAMNEVYGEEVTDLDSAMLNTFTKKIGIQGGKGQSLVKEQNGFLPFENKVYAKYGMQEGMYSIRESFQLANKHKTKINLYNEDSVDFIKRFKDYNPKTTGIYFDPPYVKSASVYAKSLPADQVAQLKKFTSGEGLYSDHKTAFDLQKKGAKFALTNDIEEGYLNTMIDKIKDSKIFAYKEGLTPTSLVVDPSSIDPVESFLKTSEKVGREDKPEIARIKELRDEKQLSNITLSGIRRAIGITELKNATPEKLDEFITILEELAFGDKLLTTLQREGLKGLIQYGKFKRPKIITQREMREQFAENTDILDGRISKRIAKELFPTVDIKEGHPIITRTVDRADTYIRAGQRKMKGRSKHIDNMMTKAEKSEKISKIDVNRKIFMAMSGAKVPLTKDQVAVVAYLKNFFKKAKFDLQLQKFRKYYIPHIEKGLMEKISEDGVLAAVKSHLKPHDPNIPVDILLALDNIIGTKKFFRFALERKGGLNHTTNIRKIVNEYSQLFETKKALDKILPEAQASQQLLLQKKATLWMQKFLQNLKGRGMDSGLRNSEMGYLAKTADAMVDFNYIRLLGLNMWSPLKNIVGGETNSFVFQSFHKYIRGKQRMLTNPVASIRLIKESGILDGSYIEMMEASVIKKGKAISNHILYGGMEIGEYSIRGTYMLGELTKEEWALAKKGKLTLSDKRFREVLDGLAITQGIYTKIDSPLFVQTWYGRAMVQFGRWRITNAMLLRRISKGAKAEIKAGNYTGPNSRRVIKMFFMTALMTYLSFELGKRGYEKARRVAIAGTELIKNIYEIFPPKILYDAVSQNPSMQILASFVFDVDTMMNYIGLAEEPYPIEFKRSLTDMYVAGLQLLETEEAEVTTLKEFESKIKEGILDDLESGKITTEVAKEKLKKGLDGSSKAFEKIVFKLSEDKYKANLRARLESKEITASDAKEELQKYLKQEKVVEKNLDSKNEKSFINKIILYAKAIGTDPVTAFNRILTKQKIRRLDSGAIIVERMDFKESQAERKTRGATKDMRLDHTIPLQLGGSNSAKNLKLVSEEEWKRYTVIENALGVKLRNGSIDKDEAQKLIKDFKSGKITGEDILKL